MKLMLLLCMLSFPAAAHAEETYVHRLFRKCNDYCKPHKGVKEFVHNGQSFELVCNDNVRVAVKDLHIWQN